MARICSSLCSTSPNQNKLKSETSRVLRPRRPISYKEANRNQKLASKRRMKFSNLPTILKYSSLDLVDNGERLKLLQVNKNLRSFVLRFGAFPAKLRVNQWMQRALDMGVTMLQREFRALSDWKPENTTCLASEANGSRNRYRVRCGDARRVIIHHPEAPSDYINANYVSTPTNEKRFICTQSPLDNTVVDFWYMIIQERSETIVMLCDFIDNEGSEKCVKYFPLKKDETMKISANVSVTNVETQRPMSAEMPWVEISLFELKFVTEDGNRETRTIRHFHWQGWLEGKVPTCFRTPIEVLLRIRDTRKPIVVHCNGGMGRTGILVAIEHLLECVESKKECPNLDELLKGLRSQRLRMILFDLQYLYIHRVIFHHFIDQLPTQNRAFLTTDNMEKYEDFIRDYEIALRPKRGGRVPQTYRKSCC